MPSSKDPMYWTVDEIVMFFCHDKAGDWSHNLACPDLIALENSLREQCVTGSALLEITDKQVKKDLGIKVLAQRLYVLKASKWLQRRSPKFQLDNLQPPPKVLLSEQQHPAEHLDDPINNTPLLDIPADIITSPDGLLISAPLLDGPPLSQTEGKRPRRMETTIIERPPTSALRETAHELPAPNSAFGKDAFFAHLLETYPPNDADVLSLLGDSSSERGYDTETREEMEEDERQSRPDTPLDTSGNVEDAEFNKIVDEYINERKTQFIEIRLPKELPKGFQIWTRGQEFPSMKAQISTRLAHLEKRCQSLRKALAEAQHSFRSSLLQACACLDPTVVDICLNQWKLSILEKTSPPPKVACPPRTPRPEKPSVNSDGEETLSSDSDSVCDTGEAVDDQSPEQLEDGLDLALVSDLEESEIPQDEEEPPSRAAHQYGPFLDYSSSEGEDLGHHFFEEERYESPAAKRRRLEKNSVHQDNSTSSLMPMTALPFVRDVALPSEECEAEGQMEANIYPVNPTHLNTHESVDLASDNLSETDEAVRVFDDVYSMMWATITEGGNRLHLVAKALTGLPNNRINQLSQFLGPYMPCVYRDYALDALKHMSDDSSVIEEIDPEESHSAMLMTALFVSWINVIQVPHGAFTAKQVKAAIVAIGEDLDIGQFAPFLKCLNDLIRGYRKWSTLSSRVQPHEKKPTQHQWPKRKRLFATVTLNQAQKDGQQRQADQDEAIRAFRSRVDYEDIPAKPVSFRDPVIQLDPYIGRWIQPHQLHGVQFMFREIVENKRPEGCLLAHTMGLGKTMQV